MRAPLIAVFDEWVSFRWGLSKHSNARLSQSVWREIPIHLYRSSFLEGVRTITAPPPVFRIVHQPPPNRILVHVFQFFRELFFRVDVEVVEAFMPKVICAVRQEPSCHRLLQGFHYNRRVSSVRLRDHEMKMLGHDDITQHLEAVTRTHFIVYLDEHIPRIRRSHEWLSLITTAGDVVVVVKTVDSDQIARHAADYRRDLLDTHSSNIAMSG